MKIFDDIESALLQALNIFNVYMLKVQYLVKAGSLNPVSEI